MAPNVTEKEAAPQAARRPGRVFRFHLPRRFLSIRYPRIFPETRKIPAILPTESWKLTEVMV